MERQLAGTIEADDLSHTAGNKGQATQGGKKALGRRACGRRKQREPGRGHYDQDRPAIIAWVSRQGAVVIQAPRDFTVQTVQQAANLAVHAGSRLSTNSASRYRAVQGDVHECVNHTQKAFARGDGHEHRTACLCSLLKPSWRVFRGVGKWNLPGSVGGFQCLRNCRQQNACAQAERILRAARDPLLPAGPGGERVFSAWTMLLFYTLRDIARGGMVRTQSTNPLWQQAFARFPLSLGKTTGRAPRTAGRASP